MWSEALRILDENSLKYYVEQLKEEVDATKLELRTYKEERANEIAALTSEKDAEIAALKAELEALKASK